eukprot:TRINITY_DN3269_c0_g1_i12.p2 TRINITY_DN3269_c0_g1~~TRINITY_DN3269_c0_g1_i12.p2  ORF type:complete len:112 (+),score=27.18 TRINITY_DN3269_c0_g1_i12:66-401(+)
MAQPPALKRAATQSSDLLLPPAKRPRISSRRSSSSALIGHAQLGDLADQEIALVAAFLRPKDVRSFSQVSKRFRSGRGQRQAAWLLLSRSAVVVVVTGGSWSATKWPRVPQ